MHTVGIYGLGYITLFGASCSTSEEEFEKTSKKKKKKKNRSKNKKTPIEPVVQDTIQSPKHYTNRHYIFSLTTQI